MSSSQIPLERLSTGSAAFDRILGGGLPVRSLTMIAGEPGAGKTLFALQMLFHLGRQGKKGLYFTTLSEPSLKLIQYMQQFSFFDEGAVGKGLTFVDLGSVVRGRNADDALKAINERVEREEPAIVIIDSFKAMRDILGDAPSIRTFVYDLAVHMAGWGAASLFVGEYTSEEIAQYAEFAIADGILRFGTQREELTAVRVVDVLKLRGADCITGRHFFEIGPDGLAFFPRVRSPVTNDHASIGSFAERAATGIVGLDDMLGGGLPRSSSTVIQGATGTGKTLLGLHFLLEGAPTTSPRCPSSRRCPSPTSGGESPASISRWRKRPISSAGSPEDSDGTCARWSSAASSPSSTSRPWSSRPTPSSIERASWSSRSGPGARCSTA